MKVISNGTADEACTFNTNPCWSCFLVDPLSWQCTCTLMLADVYVQDWWIILVILIDLLFNC